MAAFPLDGNGRVRNSFQQDDSQQPSLFSFYNPNPASNRSSLQSLHSARASLPQISRRFTTTNLPTAPGPPAGGQQQHRMNTFDSQGQDLSFSVNRDTQLRERKEAEYNFIKKKRLQFQQEMNALEREEERLRHDLGGYGAGHQSEPTTPPEHTENGFPSVFSRPNRFSSSSIVSPIGQSARSSRAGSQVTSPPSERDRAYLALTGFSPQSNSRDSGDGEEDDEYQDEVLNFDHRKAASLNRNSMPVTRRDHGARNGVSDGNSVLGHVNTTAFLFGDEYNKGQDMDVDKTPTSRNLPTYLQMHTNDDKFPILIRRDGENDLNASNDGSELSPVQSKETDNHLGVWPQFGRQSGSYSVAQSSGDDSPPHGLGYPNMSGSSTPTNATASRHSMGARIGPTGTDSQRSSYYSNNGNMDKLGKSVSMNAKLQSSFSTSSVPTINSINHGGNNAQPVLNPSTPTAEQRLHNHNVSLGRIPPSAIGSKRQSKDLTPTEVASEESKPELHANQTLPSGIADHHQTPPAANTVGPAFQTPGSYNFAGTPANMQMLDNAMNNMQIAPQPQFQQQQQWNNPTLAMYSQPYLGVGYSPFQNFGRYPDGQGRPGAQRRNQHEDSTRFANVTMESLEGELLGLCKDQHGCRYLQKKLEERKPEHIMMIFVEIKDHMIELMIDPFGNYLCQKLLECTDDDQRTQLIDNAAPEMVAIALNQHGTRALQKMIEFVTTPQQIQTVTVALEHSVVQMIQDLNGNHVIQKCLNRLSNTDAQFIFDAVAAHCVVVGTHRHGCCVIQRCIDHASSEQKAQLVAAISNCSMDLVQDPFGNYVLQYIFDLEEPAYSQPLCRTFLGEVVKLSKQKFSSNVVEKCIRIADDETRHAMIQELVNAHEFEKIADDPFANYVVQTAWDHANASDEAQLAEKIRPCLPRMRHKPYGRRFQNKVAERDKKLGINTSGTATPAELASPEIIAPAPMGNGTGYATPFGPFNMQGSQANFNSFRPQYPLQMPGYMGNPGGQPNRMDNQAPPMANFNPYPAQNQGQQQYGGGAFNRNPHHGTGWY